MTTRLPMGTVMCPECSKRPIVAKGLCIACYQRAWRARGGPAVERQRAAVKRWKQRNRDRELDYQRDYNRTRRHA
jgi:hypothetical protein